MGPVVAQIHRKGRNGGEEVGGADQVLGDVVVVLDQSKRQMILRDDRFDLRHKVPADLGIQQGLGRDLPDRNVTAFRQVAALRDGEIHLIPQKGQALDACVLYVPRCDH